MMEMFFSRFRALYLKNGKFLGPPSSTPEADRYMLPLRFL